MSDQNNIISYALNGIKVLDLTRVLGGPYATQILADHGAEVIKVESKIGDEVRGWGPPFINDMASYFINVNRNKKSIAIDLTKKEGKELILELVKSCDVLIENFKTGTMEKWGLGYEEVLSSKFPKLIHCRISGFGATGPLGGAPGYDAIVQAMTGMMSINGHASGGDVRVGAPVVDMGTGLYATIGILMAIQERHKSGLGQFIDMSLYDSALALMHPHTGNYFLSKKPGTATGNAHPNIAPYDKFKTATNEIFMGIGNDAGFVRLCKALNLDELITDKRFLSNGDRVENRIALTKYLEDALSNVDGVEFSEKLLAAGIPAGPVRNIEEAINHPQTKERQMTISKDEYKGVSSPIKFSRSRSVGVKHKPPIIGQHTKGILKEAGYNEDAINKLLSEEIVFQNKP
ncbi:CoA transferase [Alphaproteobacteria bacterium]|jgi:crotonobetainyl-CoA:carnitine CoA-transferase CaiB-like acyl-CoA transferase|nr:CoA transferase [Alphaproteobacteria bacterium]MDB9869497.1 CoA transferase [Alphaproteobacteria bacterium]|tara:strand:+ start:2070 stop:3281 length:1212 start_codon:yes stop_codon:yes gene_type:complete